MERVVLYTLVLVVLILLAVVSYNNMMARQERARGAKDEETVTDWLSKFVVHDGNVVGETVSMDGDRLILKQAGVFKSVPRAGAAIHGDEIVLSGTIDWDAAIAAGSAWHAEHTKGQDDAVTSQLTRSEDVRAPALEAMRKREADSEE